MQLRLQRLGLVSALLLAAVATPRTARAEADSFGIGDGHSGPRTIAAGDQEINSYAGVTADLVPGATTVSVTTVLGPAFAANDLVLLWRATGVDAGEVTSGDQTKRVNLATALATTSSATRSAGLVGRYEFARVASFASSTLTLTKPLLNGFTKNVTQIVRVPEFTTVNIAAGATIRARPWQELNGDPANPNPANPWVGGIVVLFANGAITNAGTIHANARGFHGGTPVDRDILNSPGLFCDNNALDGNPQVGAFSPKGEGVVHSLFLPTSGGKGNISMAGGGGNCLESGGGGGANEGAGGRGAGSLGNSAPGGLGGVGIDYDVLTRLTMGGGGGAGRHTAGVPLSSQVSFGGFGGGVVYIRGGSLIGSGVVASNGGNGEDSGLANLPPNVVSEGSGGGGAGGTVVVRLTGALDCNQIATVGGNGGNAQVLGAGIFGAGGGGGGGRILFQAASKTGTCAVAVTPGNPGNPGGGVAQGGGTGTIEPNLPPLCVPTAPGIPGSCADPTPVCDSVRGVCAACTGPFGGAPPDPCPVNVDPVCLPSGACVPCNGDFNSNATQACQLAGAPTCFATGSPAVAGSCGKCAVDADCTNGPHPGPRCDVASGACGTACTKDEDCQKTEWCAPSSTSSTAGVCVPKVPNGQPVPNGPPIGGVCNPENGQRTCLSAVCEESDDLCGKRNSSPCPGGPEQCRSNKCFDADKLCGLPNGQPCTVSGDCRSDLCQAGVCVGQPCGADVDCPIGQVCDPTTKSCVDGCRPDLQAPADGGLVNGMCPPPSVCASTDGGPVGACNAGDGGVGDAGKNGSASDGGDTAGLIEGGGCSCSSTIASATSPLSLLGAVSSVLLLMRRRSKRNGRKERA